ncbi:MAG: vWA domain-containing protein, partial [Thermodesulfobacteriota bacterium]|nr:vWA domain-containing protein [Thermodesulfobacteriota bacterium]
GWEELQPRPDSVLLRDEAAPIAEAPAEEEKENDSDGLESDLVEDVRSFLEDGDADLTRDIAVVVENPEAGTMETVLRPGTARCDVPPDEEQVRRLRQIFHMQKRLMRKAWKRRTKRGLFQGKVDARRLYRAPFDERIFKKKDPPHSDQSWHITIIADASASMGRKGGRFRPWDFAEKAFASLVKAAKSSRNHIEIFAYNEDGGRCVLTSLYRREGNVFTVLPAGRTPSGQAIVASALMLKTVSRRSIIIHITDGATNCGLKMGDAVEHCRKNSIEMVTIGCGCNQQTKDFLGACLPRERLYFADHMSSLADAIENLLEQKILGSNKRNYNGGRLAY